MIELTTTTLGAEPFFQGLPERYLDLLVKDSMLVRLQEMRHQSMNKGHQH